MSICISHGFQSSVTGFVGVLNKLLTLAGNSDALQIMERVVCERILHTVSAGNLGHVIKSVIDIRYMGKLCAISLFACHLCRFSGIVIRIRRLVPEPVGYFFVTGSIFIHGIFGAVASRVGLAHKIVAGVFRAAAVRREAEGAVDRPELPVGKRRFGQRVAVPVCLFAEARAAVRRRRRLRVVRAAGAFHDKVGRRETGLYAAAHKLHVVEADRPRIVAVVTVHTDVLNRAVLLLCEPNRGELPFLRAGREVRRIFLAAVFPVCGIVILHHRTQPELCVRAAFTRAGCDAVPLCPAGERVAFPRRPRRAHRRRLTGVPRRIHSARHTQRFAHIEAGPV